jgi:hypothetical protein
VSGPASAARGGLVLGVGVLGLVVALFQRVLGPAREIREYGDLIDVAIAQIGRNLEPLDGLARTGELGAAVPSLAQDYLTRLEEAGS